MGVGVEKGKGNDYDYEFSEINDFVWKVSK